MKNNNFMIIALVALLPVMAACKWVNKSVDDTLHGRPSADNTDYMAATDRKDNFLMNATDLMNAQKALEQLPELKGKKLVCFDDMHIYNDGRIMLELQN